MNSLTDQGIANWIFDFWYRPEKSEIIENMDQEDCQAILDNMVLLESIDYHAEEVLSQIAMKAPVQIIEFFGKRLEKEAEEDIARQYDAVPFELRKVHNELTGIAKEAISIIRSWYKKDQHSMFIYRGASLLKNIYPEAPESFQKELIEILQAGKTTDIMFVAAVLRSYEGECFLHPIFKELINAADETDEMYSEIATALESTGVTTGEYGLVEAYKRKKQEVEAWREDDNDKVKKFAKHYCKDLDLIIESQTERIEEEIALRKHQFGEDD